MPDPRGVTYSRNVVIGYEGGYSESFDEYGRRPWQTDFSNSDNTDPEWNTHLAFQGEFARLFGPRRRGRSFSLDRSDNEEDDEDYHKYHLNLEKKYKPKSKRRKNKS